VESAGDEVDFADELVRHIRGFEPYSELLELIEAHDAAVRAQALRDAAFWCVATHEERHSGLDELDDYGVGFEAGCEESAAAIRKLLQVKP
jgi:hypothetical protein